MKKIKVKTRSAAKKRFRRVGSQGSLIKRSRAYRRHLLTKKSAQRKRSLRKGGYIHKADYASISILLPYNR